MSDEKFTTFESVVITDSKNACDSLTRIESSGLQLQEKRLAIELLGIKERINAANMTTRWERFRSRTCG